MFKNVNDFISLCGENFVKTSGNNIDLFSFTKIKREQRFLNTTNEMHGQKVTPLICIQVWWPHWTTVMTFFPKNFGRPLKTNEPPRDLPLFFRKPNVLIEIR